MRIFFICTQLEAGGAQTASVRVAAELRKQGYQCENWFLYKKRDAFNESESIYTVLPRPIKSWLDYILISYKLCKILKKDRPDAVVTFTHYANILGLIMACLSGVKIRIASHRNPSWGNMSKPFMFIDKLCAVLRIYTVITAVSESTKQSFKYYPDPIYDNIKVIKNGLMFKKSTLSKTGARELFDLPNNAVIVGAVGRLSAQKNQGLLIQAVQNLNIHLAIVGDGELKTELMQLVNELNVNSRVHFLGEISGDKIPHFLHALDMYAMPSLFEGLSNALVEALCDGNPVLTSDIPSQRDVIISDDGTKNGILLPFDDPEAWSVAFENLINDNNMYSFYAERALIRSADFSMEKMTDGFKAVLHS